MNHLGLTTNTSIVRSSWDLAPFLGISLCINLFLIYLFAWYQINQSLHTSHRQKPLQVSLGKGANSSTNAANPNPPIATTSPPNNKGASDHQPNQTNSTKGDVAPAPSNSASASELKEPQGPERFAINMSQLNRSPDLTPGPFGSASPQNGFGPIYRNQSGEQQASQQLAMQEMQKQQRSAISLGKIHQRQMQAQQHQEKIACRIYIDQAMQFAQIDCANPNQVPQLVAELSGPLTFVHQLLNKAQCLELGELPKSLKCAKP